MSFLKKQSDDDERFISRVEEAIEKIVLKNKPQSIYLIKIDNWFDSKWLKFSGKSLGAFGVFNDELAVPPFVTNRVVYEKLFSLETENKEYKISPKRKDIHISQDSESNLHRKIKTLFPNSAFLWFSGNTIKNKRGTVMSYFPFEDEYISMHIEFESPEWKAKNSHGLSKNILHSILS